MNVEAARQGRVLELKLPTRHGVDVTARIRFTTTRVHFGGWRVWMLCPRCDGRARYVRRLRQDRLPAMSSGSISVPIRKPGIPCTSSNSKDRAAPNHAARPLLQAEGDALEYVPPPVRSLRPSRCRVE